MNTVMQTLRPAFMLLVIMTLLTGVIYPLVITGVAQLAFPNQANGSIMIKDGKAQGSALIGQQFDDPRYFWGRLSATGPVPYTAYNGTTLTGSSGSNYGPLNPALNEAIKARVDALRSADPQATLPIPVDLVTASASGLDPEISPAAAAYQIRRVAQARGLSEAQVAAVVTAHTTGRDFGVLGEPRVNVLQLNVALDALR